jgi:hypothetical protein
MAWTQKKIEKNSRGRWYCPPVNQGQIVVEEFAYDVEDGTGVAFRRVTDRSDPPGTTPSYSYAELPDDLEEWPDAWNVPLDADWIKVAS